jgi:hypothetical protein
MMVAPVLYAYARGNRSSRAIASAAAPACWTAAEIY